VEGMSKIERVTIWLKESRDKETYGKAYVDEVEVYYDDGTSVPFLEHDFIGMWFDDSMVKTIARTLKIRTNKIYLDFVLN
jgi:hypothetical protein